MPPEVWAEWAPRVMALLGSVSIGGIVVALIGYRKDVRIAHERTAADRLTAHELAEIRATEAETAREQAHAAFEAQRQTLLAGMATTMQEIYHETLGDVRTELLHCREQCARIPALEQEVQDCRQREQTLAARVTALEQAPRVDGA